MEPKQFVALAVSKGLKVKVKNGKLEVTGKGFLTTRVPEGHMVSDSIVRMVNNYRK